MPKQTTRKGKTIDEVWSGTWVADRLGVGLHDCEAGPRPGPRLSPRLTELLGLALRRNPKRAHLLVSQVLGKHVPQSPRTVYAAGYGLGTRVRALLGEDGAAAAVVLGYAETATGLGHCVADGLGTAAYLHSTRRPVPGVATAGGFEEAHSHATSHLLLPEDPALLAGDGPLVLVDDEFSTGNTVLNTIRDLHSRHPRSHYVVVALVDMRSPADRDRLTAFAAELGARVDLIALASGTVSLPDGVLAKGQALVEEYESAAAGTAETAAGTAETAAGTRARAPQPEPSPVVRVDLNWPARLPDGGRHGFTPAHRKRLDAALPDLAAQLTAALGTEPGRVLVLGNEELMYAPLRLAKALEEAGPAREVRFSTTTRSPVLAVDDPGYAI
ncbi:phosphoribosyltransferase family protein, partial [Streptomyces sp. WAC05950]|uniref:phosphoribosyltransferase family protein n=1 Tax=Streptomyces sp. WAC05950 TaxID=2487419 RepID=UPI0021CCA7A2